MQNLRHYFSTALCSSSSSQSVSQRKKSRPVSSKFHFNKKWESEFPWLEYDEDHQGRSASIVRKGGSSLERTGGSWVTKPFKKALEKMRAHSVSDGHIQSCEAEIAAARVVQEGSIIQQLQQVGEKDRLRNRAAIKSLIRCTHFLARHHIAHTTNFSDLVDLVVSCGGEDLSLFLERAGRNAACVYAKRCRGRISCFYRLVG